MPLPLVLGDEGAGIVDAVGPGVSRLRPGDHVILSWAPTCGRCHFCVSGRPVLCEDRPPDSRLRDGTTRMSLRGQLVFQFGSVATFASVTIVPEECAVRVRDDLPLEVAALIGCSVMTGVGAVVNTAALRPGQSLAVFGCGGVGLNAVQGGRLASAAPLIAVDVVDAKLDYARRLGATHTLNSRHEDVPSRIRELTGRGVEVAVVAVGSARAVDQAWQSLAPGGTCVMIGQPPDGELITINPRSLVGPERRLIGSCYGSARVFDDFGRLADLYLAGQLRVDELITRRYALDEVNEAFRALADGELARGVIVF
jgi:S-(hydroxymethyl)glutathione dehydrogenase/alcohol dehydrogenase